jgi:hypothetical protein
LPDDTPKFIDHEQQKEGDEEKKKPTLVSFTAMQRFRTGAFKNLNSDEQ